MRQIKMALLEESDFCLPDRKNIFPLRTGLKIYVVLKVLLLTKGVF
jgi:hypothetical protein